MRKLFPLVILATTACSDTYNNYVVGDSGESAGLEINTCEDLAQRDYECNQEKYEKYKEMWDVSIEDQLRHYANTCSPKKADFFGRGPEFISCMEQSSCEEIKAGACDQYMPEH